MSNLHKKLTKKRVLIPTAIILLLIVARILLPFVLLRVINDRLANLDGYRGYVKDIDLHLYRGAYVIDSIDFVKTGDSIPVPFVSVKTVDLSVQWEALFDGRIVAEIILTKPDLNFAVAKGKSGGGEGGKVHQSGEGVDWVKTIKDLVPIKINRLVVSDGKIAYRDFSTDPEVDVRIDHLDMEASNLSNATSDSSRLPSSVEATGNAFGKGNFNLSAKMNILKKIPDLDLNFSIESVDMTHFNDFLRAYSNADVESGIFNLYTEVILNDSELEGYVKPVMEHVDVVDWKKEDEPFIDKLWESLVGAVAEIFENQPTDRLATRVPLRGNVEDIDAGLLTTIWNIFRNAFIEAFSKDLEGTIEFSSGG